MSDIHIGGPPPIDPGQVGGPKGEPPGYTPVFALQAAFLQPKQAVKLKEITKRLKEKNPGGRKDREVRNTLKGFIPDSTEE